MVFKDVFGDHLGFYDQSSIGGILLGKPSDMKRNTSQEPTGAECFPLCGGIQARSLTPLWTLDSPRGVSKELWAEMGRRARNFKPNRVPQDFANHWRNFSLACLFASQPRNVTRVGNRLGSTYLYLYSSGAQLHESLMDVWSPDRVSLFIKSLTGERYTPQTRDHIARDLKAMRDSYLGKPKTICRPQGSKDCKLNLEEELQRLLKLKPELRNPINLILDWVDHADPKALMPKIAVRAVIPEIKNNDTKSTMRNLQKLRFAKLIKMDISGFVILETMGHVAGFPLNINDPEFDFFDRQTRFLPVTVSVAENHNHEGIGL